MSELSRKRSQALRLPELIAVALGGMVGGGIFSILGVSVEKIGNATPLAITAGGIIAFFAAYSYVKLAKYYKDPGATYSFFKKTFPNSNFAASVIGWLISFGYISTLALYAFTFSSYLCGALGVEKSLWLNHGVAAGVLLFFMAVNLISVKGMGRLEDIMVYTKIVVLLIISGLFLGKGEVDNILPIFEQDVKLGGIMIVAALTFVAYEGFQLVIMAWNEVDKPEKNVPKAIYISIAAAVFIYLAISIGALFTLPKDLIIQDKEFALASGASDILGGIGLYIVMAGALLATSSAISGTLFGASRQMAAIAKDGYLPRFLNHKVKGFIPDKAIVLMTVLAFLLIISGGLEILLEFGSITFIGVSFLMAYANFKLRKETDSHIVLTLLGMITLSGAAVLILGYELMESPKNLLYIGSVYVILILSSWIYSKFSPGKKNTEGEGS